MSNETSAQRTFNVALIGLGMVGPTYVDAFRNMSRPIRLKGVLSTRLSTADAFVKKHWPSESSDSGDSAPPLIYSDISAIANDDDIDFVIVSTPPNARDAVVNALVASKKPILMEKPIERNLAAATRLCDLCESHGVPLGIVLQHRARPSVAALKERVQAGDTGKLLSAEIIVPWWRDQAYYDEPGRGSYERDGGGVMISQAIHVMDLALQFTGPTTDVIALTARSEAHDMESENFVSAGLHFANGAPGALFCSTASYPGRVENVVLHYERVSATLESGLLILNWRDGRRETIGRSAASGSGADPMAFKSHWHRFIIENFASVLEGRAELLATGRSALEVHALIAALEASGQSGQREKVPAI